MNRSLLVWLGLALAVLLLAALGVATNLDDILAAFRRGGLGLLWLCLLQPIQVLPMAEAWRLLYLPAERPRHLPLPQWALSFRERRSCWTRGSVGDKHRCTGRWCTGT